VVRRRDHGGQVVLKGLAQDRVEGQVRPDNVLLDPHVAAKALDLLPQAIQILKNETKNIAWVKQNNINLSFTLDNYNLGRHTKDSNLSICF
jgi:hypothetical protein